MIAALVQWQRAGLVTGVVVVLLVAGFLAGSLYEHLRRGGSSALRRQREAAWAQINDYWLAAEEALAAAERHRAAADAEHGRADRERSRRQAMGHELVELRIAAIQQGRTAARAADVIDMSRWQTDHAIATADLSPP